MGPRPGRRQGPGLWQRCRRRQLRGKQASRRWPDGVGHSPARVEGLWEAVQRKLPSYRIETKAPFAEGDFTSGGLPPVLMPQLTQQLL